jgi:hypothetical protein
MAIENLHRIITLAAKASDSDISLTVEDGQLQVGFLTNQPPDLALLSQLKAHKEELMQYLEVVQANGNPVALADTGDFVVEHDGKRYYEVSQWHIYWATDEFDRELRIKKFSLLRYVAGGGLDAHALTLAVRYLVSRHESLRSTFHKRGNRYYLRAEALDDLRDLVQVKHEARDLGGDPGAVEQYLGFKDHVFDLTEGPLFLVRLVQRDDGSSTMSLKIDHSIYDLWSLQILIKDLTAAFAAYATGLKPQLPALPFQYKEYMLFLNHYVQKNRDAHQQYWESRYDRPPGELKLPGTDRHSGRSSGRVGKTTRFLITREVVQSLLLLAGKHATSLFIILQAALKAYLFGITRQGDLVVAVIRFGRTSLPGLEDQIGLYTTQAAVRTVLDAEDTFDDVIRKVIFSNEEAETYSAYPYLDVLVSETPARTMNSFFKFRLQYSDRESYPGGFLPEEPADDAAPGQAQLSDVNIDFELHFIYRGERTELQVVYDVELYEEAQIRDLMDGYLAFLAGNATAPGQEGTLTSPVPGEPLLFDFST